MSFINFIKIIGFSFLVVTSATYGKEGNISAREFKNISYIVKSDGSLPKSSDQIFFCHNESVAWLELTNYEFLINGSESNKLVTVFIGITKEQAAIEKDIIKEAIEILDPQSVFEFQNYILTDWDQKAVQDRYNLVENYKEQAKAIKKFVTHEEIKNKAALGFTAYYPNPIYYADSNNKLFLNQELFGLKGDPGVLLDNSAPQELNEFHEDVIKKLYPEIVPRITDSKSCSKKHLGDYKFSDFRFYSYKDLKPLPLCYVFRGSFMDLEKTYEEKGFKSEMISGYQSLAGDSIEDFYQQHNISSQDIKDGNYDLEYLKTIGDFWKFREQAFMLNSDKAYVSSSKSFNIAKIYADAEVDDRCDDANRDVCEAVKASMNIKSKTGYIYSIATKKGINLPTLLTDEEGNELAHHEVVIPVKVDFKDIVGVRMSYKEQLVGPVFIRNNLELTNPAIFWTLLQLYGGKPQTKEIPEVTKVVLKNLCTEHATTHNSDNCIKLYKILGASEISAASMCFVAGDYSVRKEVVDEICKLINCTY